uniref:Uncharacterized protein n=1 Tax=Photinus pyralis TaxID=7054 RepID=A0A1Y1NCD3_PHOPY
MFRDLPATIDFSILQIISIEDYHKKFTKNLRENLQYFLDTFLGILLQSLLRIYIKIEIIIKRKKRIGKVSPSTVTMQFSYTAIKLSIDTVTRLCVKIISWKKIINCCGTKFLRRVKRGENRISATSDKS